jgi:hypothetical protein
MATWEDLRAIAGRLPELEEQAGRMELRVRGKPVAWDRPLRKVDLQALGDAAPKGTIIGIRTPDVGEQQALLQSGPDAVFITPHFEGYPAVLVELDRIPVDELEELVTEAWLAQAPKRLTKAWLDERESPER